MTRYSKAHFSLGKEVVHTVYWKVRKIAKMCTGKGKCENHFIVTMSQCHLWTEKKYQNFLFLTCNSSCSPLLWVGS